ncbi:MAG: DUF4338 domain-containing protein [Syntrophaceae bacterium]|nr:DUF4338 domain-containing protein [Syntrophaceae bacterium]
MKTEKVIQGRTITSADIVLIRSLLRQNPSWSRRCLSQDLCRRWDWRNGKGQIKDMACRALLVKLEEKGEIRLPARRGGRPNHRGYRIIEVDHDRSAIECDLKALLPVSIELLPADDSRLSLFKLLLHRYHYLGLHTCVGETIKYMAHDRHGRILACMLFGSAAWKAKDRDAFIGWDAAGRERNLFMLTNNTRFLVLPWVRIKNLASHLLGKVCARVSADWIDKYGHPIHLLETFVQRDRFRGTCYRAAGWTHVGATVGRSRNDVDGTMIVPVKDIYLYPLNDDFRGRLCA